MAIELVPHDPLWSLHYDEAQQVLSRVLGGYVVDIQHVGSTSIPGIMAKPVVDIAVAIESYPLPDSVLETVKALGYTYWGEYGIPRRHLFFTRESVPGFNIHINELSNEEFQRHVLFRDFLRAHPEVAREYETLKMELAAQHTVVNDYAESKSEFVQGVLERARYWRDQGYDFGPIDTSRIDHV
jgi:GrpB-like predicted nucleotidyltransferase (UPF0157 family)